MNNWIYNKEKDNRTRYSLGLDGTKPLIVFGINPSIAEPGSEGDTDPTIEKIKRISKVIKCDGWIMLNIYPQRATHPKDIHLNLDNTIHQRNLLIIKRILSLYPNHKLIAAWGNSITKRPFLTECLKDIICIATEMNAQWHCFGINRTGYPKHPLYINEKLLSITKYKL